jgi:DNA-binding response OmpR family regulator
MAITAYGNGVAKEALEAGADRATTKPVQFSALAVEIRELLARYQLPARPEPQAPAE